MDFFCLCVFCRISFDQIDLRVACWMRVSQRIYYSPLPSETRYKVNRICVSTSRKTNVLSKGGKALAIDENEFEQMTKPRAYGLR